MPTEFEVRVTVVPFASVISTLTPERPSHPIFMSAVGKTVPDIAKEWHWEQSAPEYMVGVRKTPLDWQPAVPAAPPLAPPFDAPLAPPFDAPLSPPVDAPPVDAPPVKAPPVVDPPEEPSDSVG